MNQMSLFDYCSRSGKSKISKKQLISAKIQEFSDLIEMIFALIKYNKITAQEAYEEIRVLLKSLNRLDSKLIIPKNYWLKATWRIKRKKHKIYFKFKL